MNGMIEIIDAVTNNIPTLLKYFIPGAISMKLFMFLRGKKDCDYQYFVFKSVVISGLIAYPVQSIWSNWSDIALFAWSIGWGILLSIIVAKVLECDGTQNVLQKIHIQKTTRRFWDDVININKGTYAEVKLKGDNLLYGGSVEYLEEKEEGDIYISIIRISVIYPDGTKEKQAENVRMVFNTADVFRLSLKEGKK